MTATTTSNSTTKPKIKTEPVPLIESGDTSNEDEEDDGENITEMDTGESSSTTSSDSDIERVTRFRMPAWKRYFKRDKQE